MPQRPSKATIGDEAGRYNFFNVEPGTYEISVTKDGFNQAKFPAQTVQVGFVLTLNATLQIGSSTTVVEVSAAVGAELQTVNATVGSTISESSLIPCPTSVAMPMRL